MFVKYFCLILTFVLTSTANLFEENVVDITKSNPECGSLNPELVAEIEGYRDIVNSIIETATSGEFQGHLFNQVAKFSDTFGPRWAGSLALESSIDYILNHMATAGLSNVHSEHVSIPYTWTRGIESAELLSPIQKRLTILGQVPTVSTPPEGITAQVLVVSTVEELEVVQDQIPGKIVLFDYDYTSYGDALPYRRQASSLAAKYGAVATLIRSTTPFSLNSPHSSGVSYDPDLPKIPTASLTVEDSALFRRSQESNKTVLLNLILENTLEDGGISRNAMGELGGHTNPEEIVILAGHIDSVDLGMGALDDGAGVFMATEALVLLKHLNLVPKRTIRSVLFTAEEMGLIGAIQYVDAHEAELNSTIMALEADQGAFKPLGLNFAGSEMAACIVEQVLNLLKPINAANLSWYNQTTPVSSDITMLQMEGVPSAGLDNTGMLDHYFWFHHSDADTMSVLKTEELDENLAVWAAVAFVVADISVTLPRDDLQHKL